MIQTAVITGDRGFVGRHLRRRLLANGARVIGISRRPADEPASATYTPLVLDLSDRAQVRSATQHFRAATVVFHLAAHLPQSEDDLLEPHLADNVRATDNLLEMLSWTDVPLIASSTMSVFGLPPAKLPVNEDARPMPVEAYGLTKFAAECLVEQAARAGAVPAVVLRYPGIFGPGYDYGAIAYYAQQALAGQTVLVYGGGRIVRDYVHVEDVVDANLLAAERVRQLSFQRYHIGGGEPRTLVEIAHLVVCAAGQGEVQTNERPGPMDFSFDIARARRDLRFQPQSLTTRIAQYVEHVRNEQLASTNKQQADQQASQQQ